jgi:hypothetical protein
VLSSISVEHIETAKWVFVALYVAATVGVLIGVYWEGEKFDNARQQIGWRVLLWSLAAEIFLGAMIFAFDGWISRVQRTEIVTLETRLAARTLSDDQVATIKSQLHRYAGQAFEIIPYWQNRESLDIANRIADTLTGAGWTIDQPKAATMLVGVVTGVTVSTDKDAPSATQQAASALIAALNDHQIEARRDQDSGISPPTGKIYMNVGIKP